ncbi:hypothetical protein [Pararhizobium sp.]|uniref:hypothetical protein n=1 Tax=Pararhizobium sp. TaxID=1977563 RepID=UPI003BACE3D7
MDISSTQKQSFETANYHVTHDHSSPDHVVISFASRGFYGAGEPIEEFKGTLSKLGVSCIFITDKSAHWYNHPDTLEMFSIVNDLAKSYKKIAVIGDSMGGSGAIAFTNYNDAIDRVLTFNPQFSIARPFIDFDLRYRHVPDEIKHQLWLDFAKSPIKSKVRILFGNNEWEDYIHASMFEACGFTVAYANGLSHGVPYQLKRHAQGNRLLPILAAFCDFSRDFSDDALRHVLGDLNSHVGLLPGAVRVSSITLDKQGGNSQLPVEVRSIPSPRVPDLIAKLGVEGASEFLRTLGIAQESYVPEVSLSDPYNTDVSYTYRTGRYLRVLNYVFFQVSVNFTLVRGQGRGDLQVSLPYTSAQASVDGGGTVVFTNVRINWPEGFSQLSAAVSPGSDHATLRAFRTSDNSAVIQAGDLGEGDCGFNIVGFYLAA